MHLIPEELWTLAALPSPQGQVNSEHPESAAYTQGRQ